MRLLAIPITMDVRGCAGAPKTGSNGNFKSHPFIIGYRGGIYRLLWGGSAVHFPILEIELADLDGDRNEELIVLEDRGDGSGR